MKLSEARTDAEVLDVLARRAWHTAHDGAECPDNRIPAPENLAAWQSEWPADAMAECAQLLTALLRSLLPATLDKVPDFRWEFRGDSIVVIADTSGLNRTTGHEFFYSLLVPLIEAHNSWCALPEPRPRHPLAPLVDAWQRLAPVPTLWDNRRHTNLPAPFAATRHVMLAQDDRAGIDHLPFDWNAQPSPDESRFEVAYLPTMEPDIDSLLPLAMLDVFSAAASRGRGGPVPVPARIGWEVVLALAPEARTGPAILTRTLADLHQMVYPATSGWRTTTGQRLLRGLFNLDATRIRWKGDARGGRYPLVEVYRDPPALAAPDELVVFLSHVPPGGRQGPQVDRLVLRHLAAASARQHRMMLVAYCLIDRFGTVNGRLIAPTIPVVRRDAAGYVLDAHGRVVTERGAPTRRATHRRAVQTGDRERNPEADRYPWLTDRDLILIGYPYVAGTTTGRRDQRRRVLADAKALRAAGRLDFEAKYRTPRHGGPRELVALRLLPSIGHLETHAARWAARKHGF